MLIKTKKLSNGFIYIEIQNNSAEVKIALNGGHIFHYQRVDEEPALWLSEITDFENGKSIRGGIPICWPWFGKPERKTLQHGFARTSMWIHSSTNEIDANTTEVVLKLQDSKESLEFFPYKFELALHVEIGESLKVELKTTNLDTKSFEITQALHTYFNISNIDDVEISGLEKKPYLDALTWRDKVQKGVITFNQEVDRVYQEVDKKINIKDKNRTLHVENSGSSSCVVWNPWIDKCSKMAIAKNDMKEDAYKEFVCVESANAFDDFIVIEPSKSHSLKAIIY